MNENLLKEINFLAHSKGVNEFTRDRLKLLYREVVEQNKKIERLEDEVASLQALNNTFLDELDDIKRYQLD